MFSCFKGKPSELKPKGHPLQGHLLRAKEDERERRPPPPRCWLSQSGRDKRDLRGEETEQKTEEQGREAVSGGCYRVRESKLSKLSNKGWARLRAFTSYCFTENMQLSPSLT